MKLKSLVLTRNIINKLLCYLYVTKIIPKRYTDRLYDVIIYPINRRINYANEAQEVKAIIGRIALEKKRII